MVACQDDFGFLPGVLHGYEHFILHGFTCLVYDDVVEEGFNAQGVDIPRRDAGGDQDVKCLDFIAGGELEWHFAGGQDVVVLVAAEWFLLAVVDHIEGKEVFGVPVRWVESEHFEILLFHELVNP